MDLQNIKQRFEIIGNSQGLNRAIEIAVQVAPTDLSVLITGESGVGKEVFPKIIHSFSSRKHNKFIAVNCGAIPEGTIDSELFGHEKGAFTGALSDRKGYFQEADGGTIFLDEVGELPTSTQARLLRVLESGEFIKVGSSKVLKSNVRVVAATNVNILNSIQQGKFREDLYYRLNAVPISIPSLRNRPEDINILFRKFSRDFADKYRMPAVSLTNQAKALLKGYRWPGNIRQLKNITEQMSSIETEREISADVLKRYLPTIDKHNLPAIYTAGAEKTFQNEREILYQVLFDMKRDVNDLKKLVVDLMENRDAPITGAQAQLIESLHSGDSNTFLTNVENSVIDEPETINDSNIEDTEEYVEELLSLEEKEKELIQKALIKHNGKRKSAAQELGISERTLYRKIKEYDIKG